MGARQSSNWSLLTNHGHVLLCIADQADIRIRDIAERAGITERAAQRIIAELESGGYLSHERIGRRNRYEIHRTTPFRHPLERHLDVQRIAEAGASTGETR